LDYFYLD
jgi:hypothetical protein